MVITARFDRVQNTHAIKYHEDSVIVNERPSRPVNVYERANDDTSLDKIRQILRRMNLRSNILIM